MKLVSKQAIKNVLGQIPLTAEAYWYLRHWIEPPSLLGMALSGLGHSVTFAYLPFARWQEPIDPFNLRRQNLYAENILAKAHPLIKVVPLLNQGKSSQLPPE